MSDPGADGVPCLWMRGGTSKGAYFLAADLPADPAARDALLLRIFGSPDPRQIDGIGGADPLTSKVAILSPSTRSDADVDYLFLQVFVDRPLVSDAQPCGNILAGVGPAAIERGLVPVAGETTQVRIRMLNTGEVATARVATPQGRVCYAGAAAIDGVPGTAAAVPLMFENIAGSMTGALLPTGNAADVIDGIEVTLIDNGMPCVILRAADVGLTGEETREALEGGNAALKARLEAIRLKAGPLMNLGDVSAKSVPKMALVSAARAGGAISTRSFIPHRVHASVGVLAAVTVATACRMAGSPAAALAAIPADGRFLIEHPTGAAEVFLDLGPDGALRGAGTVRTARKLFDGRVFAGPPREPAAMAAAIDGAASAVETMMSDTAETAGLVRSTARVRTPKAAGYLAQLCKHFAHKVPASYEGNVGQVSFAKGDCRLSAEGDVLTMTVESADPEAIPMLQDVVARHLACFAFREELAIGWQPA